MSVEIGAAAVLLCEAFEPGQQLGEHAQPLADLARPEARVHRRKLRIEVAARGAQQREVARCVDVDVVARRGEIVDDDEAQAELAGAGFLEVEAEGEVAANPAGRDAQVGFVRRLRDDAKRPTLRTGRDIVANQVHLLHRFERALRNQPAVRLDHRLALLCCQSHQAHACIVPPPRKRGIDN